MNYGRKANGPQVYRTPQRKAHDIALSIVAHQAAGRAKTMSDYGVTDEAMITMIHQAVEQMTTQQAA